jgi:hypothetical protein
MPHYTADGVLVQALLPARALPGALGLTVKDQVGSVVRNAVHVDQFEGLA